MSDMLIRAPLSRYECSLDDKRRFSVPPPLRALFGVQVTNQGLMHHMVILPWFGGPLALLPMPRWKQLEQPLLELDFTTPDLLAAKRAVLSRAVPTHTDPEGRILLSPEHLEWIGIPAGTRDRVMVVGLASHVEVWKADTWTAQDAVTAEQYSRHLDALFGAIRPGLALDGGTGEGSGGGSVPEGT